MSSQQHTEPVKKVSIKNESSISDDDDYAPEKTEKLAKTDPKQSPSIKVEPSEIPLHDIPMWRPEYESE